MIERKSVICPVDSHECFLALCAEYEGTIEQPCMTVVDSLAKASCAIIRINNVLYNNIVDDPDRPSFEEFNNLVNIEPTVTDISERLEIDVKCLVEKVKLRIPKYLGRI